jgi:hypothetical protein
VCRASDERVTNIVRLDAQENSTAFSDAAQSASSRDDHRLEFSASVTQWHTGMVMDIGREVNENSVRWTTSVRSRIGAEDQCGAGRTGVMIRSLYGVGKALNAWDSVAGGRDAASADVAGFLRIFTASVDNTSGDLIALRHERTYPSRAAPLAAPR